MHQTPNSFRGARTCARSSITMPSLVGLGFHPPPGRPKTVSFFTGSIARSARCRYLIYSEANFEVFPPAGATHIAPKGPLLHAKFHPHRFNDKCVGPQKLKFLLRFDQNVEYKRPAASGVLRMLPVLQRLGDAYGLSLIHI